MTEHTLIDRPQYTEKLLDFANTPLIKVITGMRRCGKSSVMQLLMDKLKVRGTAPDHIVYLNLDSLANEALLEAGALYRHVKERVKNKKRCYLLLDEVQEVKEWPRAVNSLMVDFDVDITITGSNAHLLSSELGTFIAGRYVEIPMLPLSFAEYRQFSVVFYPQEQPRPLDALFEDYMKFGSLPVLFYHRRDVSFFESLLLGIYNTVLTRDILERNKVRDVAQLDRVLRFALANIGQTISARRISDTLKSEHMGISHSTVVSYLEMFCQAFLLYRVAREDVSSRDVLRTLDKYYVVDLGIRNSLLGFRQINMGSMLENLVYLELLRQGFRVMVGKVDTLEVDFVAETTNQRLYIQVCQSITDPRTKERELRPFARIQDGYPRILLSMDRTIAKDENGVLLVNAVDWLAGERALI